MSKNKPFWRLSARSTLFGVLLVALLAGSIWTVLQTSVSADFGWFFDEPSTDLTAPTSVTDPQNDSSSLTTTDVSGAPDVTETLPTTTSELSPDQLITDITTNPDGSSIYTAADGTRTSVSPPVNGQQTVTTTSPSGIVSTRTVPAGSSATKPGGTAAPETKSVNAGDVGTFFSNFVLGTGVGGNLGAYIQRLYQWALVIGAGLAVIMIMFSGYVYITSAGDPEGIRSAKDYLTGALIGLGVLILTATILNTLSVRTGTTQTPASTGPTTTNPGPF